MYSKQRNKNLVIMWKQLKVDASITEPRRYTEIRAMDFLSQIRTLEFIGIIFYFSWNIQFSNYWVGKNFSSCLLHMYLVKLTVYITAKGL